MGGVARPPRFGQLGTGPLTSLDQRVLDALPRGRGQRVESIARTVDRAPYVRGGPVPPELVAEVRRTLRGFEHLGRAVGRGGWWRAP